MAPLTPRIDVRSCEATDRATHEAIAGLCAAAWPQGDFTPDDLAHAEGGVHLVIRAEGALASHAALIVRDLRVGESWVRAGYLEAVATAPLWRGRGLASALVRRANELIRADASLALGALSTGAPAFYERLGWERWRGPTWVVGERETQRPDEGVMVLATGRLTVDPEAPIAVRERTGDAW